MISSTIMMIFPIVMNIQVKMKKSYNVDEIEDEEVDNEEELSFCICGMPNNDEMIACEQRNCRVQ